MSNPEKPIQIVVAYLESAFSDGVVNHEEDSGTRDEKFRVDVAGMIYLLRVSNRFLTNLTETEIQQRLEGWQTAEHLRSSADRRLRLRRDGIVTTIPDQSSRSH